MSADHPLTRGDAVVRGILLGLALPLLVVSFVYATATFRQGSPGLPWAVTDSPTCGAALTTWSADSELWFNTPPHLRGFERTGCAPEARQRTLVSAVALALGAAGLWVRKRAVKPRWSLRKRRRKRLRVPWRSTSAAVNVT